LDYLTAGFMIAITKPFKKDDYVDVAGLSGSIANVGISITTLITLDNKRVIIPNSKVCYQLHCIKDKKDRPECRN